jgi:hypothetical protein
MARIKGAALHHLLRAARERGALDVVLAEVPPEAGEALTSPIHLEQWYAYGTFTALLEAITRAHADQGPSALRSMAREAGRRELSLTFKILVSAMRLDAIMQRAQAAWPRHCDTGRCVVVRHWRTGYEGEIRGFPDIHPLHCLYLEGWLEGIVDALGAEDVHTTHRRAEAVCRYATTWSQRRGLFT